jgi:hypothetical protein
MELTDDASLAAYASGAPVIRPDDCYQGRSPAERSGELRLVLAILEDAIMLYVKSLCADTGSQPESRVARAWLESRDRSSPFAFECICDLLGLDSACIRRGLRAMRARPIEAAARLAVRHGHAASRPVPGPDHLDRRRVHGDDPVRVVHDALCQDALENRGGWPRSARSEGIR